MSTEQSYNQTYRMQKTELEAAELLRFGQASVTVPSSAGPPLDLPVPTDAELGGTTTVTAGIARTTKPPVPWFNLTVRDPGAADGIQVVIIQGATNTVSVDLTPDDGIGVLAVLRIPSGTRTRLISTGAQINEVIITFERPVMDDY